MSETKEIDLYQGESTIIIMNIISTHVDFVKLTNKLHTLHYRYLGNFD